MHSRRHPGGIPEDLAALKQLKILDLSKNMLEGGYFQLEVAM